MSFSNEEIAIIGEIEHTLDLEGNVEKLKEISKAAWDGVIESAAIRSWLGNFTGDCFGNIKAERNLALWLALHYSYYTDNDIRSLSKNLWWKYVHAQLLSLDSEEDFKKFTLERKLQYINEATIIQPLGNAGGSGTNITYFFRQVNGLQETMFEGTEIEAHRFLVLVDDATLSGSQATEEMEKYLKYSESTKFLLTFISTNEAKEKLKEQCRVISAIDIDARSKCFSTESYVFGQHRNWCSLAKRMCRYYGKKLDSHNPIGYKNGQYLFSFYYNTPNNTLPIFWQTNNGWAPLFISYYGKNHEMEGVGIDKYY